MTVNDLPPFRFDPHRHVWVLEPVGAMCSNCHGTRLHPQSEPDPVTGLCPDCDEHGALAEKVFPYLKCMDLLPGWRYATRSDIHRHHPQPNQPASMRGAVL